MNGAGVALIIISVWYIIWYYFISNEDIYINIFLNEILHILFYITIISTPILTYKYITKW